MPISDLFPWAALPSVWEADFDLSPDMMTGTKTEGRKLKEVKKCTRVQHTAA
jgi:hypothetical protein